MTREIKFRAWTPEERKMYYSPDMRDWDGFDAWLRLDCEDNDVCEGDIILMQSTSLKDKNGKEIYEKDVIKYGGLCWRVDYDAPGFVLCRGKELAELYQTQPIYVIGNIYENPELLGDKK